MCHDRLWRILAVNVVSAFFGKPNRAWSTCEENTAFHEERQDIFQIQHKYKGTAYALALDASRLGLKDKPVEQDQLIAMLRNAGHRLAQVSPRLWKMDDKTVTLPDLVEKARKIDQDLVLIAEGA